MKNRELDRSQKAFHDQWHPPERDNDEQYSHITIQNYEDQNESKRRNHLQGLV